MKGPLHSPLTLSVKGKRKTFGKHVNRVFSETIIWETHIILNSRKIYSFGSKNCSRDSSRSDANRIQDHQRSYWGACSLRPHHPERARFYLKNSHAWRCNSVSSLNQKSSTHLCSNFLKWMQNPMLDVITHCFTMVILSRLHSCTKCFLIVPQVITSFAMKLELLDIIVFSTIVLQCWPLVLISY